MFRINIRIIGSRKAEIVPINLDAVVGRAMFSASLVRYLLGLKSSFLIIMSFGA